MNKRKFRRVECLFLKLVLNGCWWDYQYLKNNKQTLRFVNSSGLQLIFENNNYISIENSSTAISYLILFNYLIIL